VLYNPSLKTMPQYEYLTDSEIMNLTGQIQDLTPEAQSELQIEIKRRNITSDILHSYQEESSKIKQEEMLKIRLRSYRGTGTKLYGETSRNFDALSGDETFETTLWFVIFWFPLFPIASYEIKLRYRENWWERILPNTEFTVLRKLPRNWYQIFFTWIKAIAIVFALAFIALKLP